MSGIRRSTSRELVYGEQGTRLLRLSRTGAADLFFDDVSLLLPMEGANNSTAFLDAAPVPSTFTRVGTPVISTTTAPNRISSGDFTTAGHYISTGSIDPVRFGAANFCIETWAYPIAPATGAERCIMGLWSATSPDAQAWMLYLASGSLRFIADLAVNDNVIFNVSDVITQERWYYIRVDRNRSTMRLIVDRTIVAIYNCGTAGIATGTNTFGIGGYNRGTGGTSTFLGYLGPSRITKRSRGATAFLPPVRFPLS